MVKVNQTPPDYRLNELVNHFTQVNKSNQYKEMETEEKDKKMTIPETCHMHDK